MPVRYAGGPADYMVAPTGGAMFAGRYFASGQTIPNGSAQAYLDPALTIPATDLLDDSLAATGSTVTARASGFISFWRPDGATGNVYMSDGMGGVITLRPQLTLDVGDVYVLDPQFGPTPAPGGDITANLAAAVAKANSFNNTLRQRRIVLPAGKWTTQGNHYVSNNTLRVVGPGAAVCQIKLPPGAVMFYTDKSLQLIDLQGFSVGDPTDATSGGFGLLWMPNQTVSSSNPNVRYRINDVVLNNITGTGVYSGANGPPYWDVNLRVTGKAAITDPGPYAGVIGFALNGVMDASNIKIEATRCKFAVKAANGGHTSTWYVSHVRDAVAQTAVVSLSSALSIGAAITSLPVTALAQDIGAGTVTLLSGDNSQTFTTTGASAGATSLPVTSATPNYAYPVSTIVTVSYGRLASTSPTWTNTDVWLLPSYGGSVGRAYTGGTFLAGKQGLEGFALNIDNDYLVADALGTLAPASSTSGRGLIVELGANAAMPYTDGSGLHMLPEVLAGWTVDVVTVSGGIQLVIKKNGTVMETSRTLTSTQDASQWGDGKGTGNGTTASATSKYTYVRDVAQALDGAVAGGSVLAADLPAAQTGVPFSTFGSAMPNYQPSFGFFKHVSIIANTKSLPGRTFTPSYIKSYVAPKNTVGNAIVNLRVLGIPNGGNLKYMCEFLGDTTPPAIMGMNSITGTAGDGTGSLAGTPCSLPVSNVPGVWATDGNVLHVGNNPQVAFDSGGAAGTGASNLTVVGNDRAMTVRWRTGTSPSIGAQVVVTFGQPYGAAPLVMAGSVTTQVQQVTVTSVSASGFTLSIAGGPNASANYGCAVTVIPAPA